MLRPRLTATGRDGVRCGFVTGTSGVASGNAAAGSSRPRALGVTRAPPRGRPASSSAAARPASEFGVSNAAARGCCRFRPGHGSLSPGAGSVDTPSPAAASITQDVPPDPQELPQGGGASALPGSSRRVTGSPRPLARWPLPIPMRLRGWGRLCRSAFSQTSSPAGCCFGGANAWSENLGFSRLWLKACNAQLPGDAAQVRTPGSRNVHPGFAPRKPG